MPEKMMLDLMSELQSLRISLEGLRVTLATLVRAAEDHETRVRALERQQQRLWPVVSALLFALGSFVTALIERWV